MKQLHLMLGAALATVVLTQTGCATHVESLPLQSVAAHPDASHDVALYFGSQEHPAVKSELGEASYSVRFNRTNQEAGRPTRTTYSEKTACQRALSEALDRLRADAKAHGANAVINVKTRFHSTETASDTHYTCGVSESAAAIGVKGERVILQSN